jgi:AraC-like DNA-binding protein
VNTSIHIDFLSVVIFIGVTLGFLLSFFLILKPSSNREANRFQGLLLLSLSLVMLEQALTITGYIVTILPLTFSTASLNLLFGPFLYLFVKRSLGRVYSGKELVHFILPFLYLVYLVFDLIQPNEFKYNIYVSNYHPDWPRLDVHTTISNDPLNINRFLTPLQAVQILFYIGLSFSGIAKKAAEKGSSIFRTTDDLLRSLRFVVFHFLMIVLIFMAVKIYFHGNAGDYFIGIYVTFFTLFSIIRVMDDSSYFDRSSSFLDISIGKYRKSSLTETGKKKILSGILLEFDTREYFLENLASLSDLAKRIGESPHHVSQVINEQLNKNFFELLASYRVQKAKEIMAGDKGDKLTIEEISEMVGYNSKAAFNNSFKKLTGKTPSEFRKDIKP